MSEANRTLATRWFDEVWNQGSQSTIDELFHPEGQCFGFPEPYSSIGQSEFKRQVTQVQSAFSGIRMTIEDLITENDMVVVRWSVTMNHTGDAVGITPTGEPVALSGISICQIQNGQIIKGWNALDLTRITTHLSKIAAD